MNVRFVDTSILLNLLDVEGCTDEKEEVQAIFEQAKSVNDSFVLPLATIIETGNHIAHIDDGNLRRTCAGKFSELLRTAQQLKDNWSLMPGIDDQVLDAIIKKLPDFAMREIGIGDVSIIEQFEWYWQTRSAIGHIMIWSLDSDLSGYSHEGGLLRRKDK